MYDFAHPIQDALEGITHSLCSLEFEDAPPAVRLGGEQCRPCPAKPRQIEFARLGIDHTVMSKRKLRKLVEEGIVSGWDDPRMPTLCGLRRRGYTPTSIRNFCERIGVAKSAQHGGVRLPGALPARGPQRHRRAHDGACCIR